MTEHDTRQWCRQNNWDEPRQLPNGSWVAFPPGGVIETPLPIQSQPVSEPIINRIQDALNAVILIISAMIVGAIAIIISPFFWQPTFSKKNQESR